MTVICKPLFRDVWGLGKCRFFSNRVRPFERLVD